MAEAVVVASSRTPLAKSHRGSFNLTRPDELLAQAIDNVMSKVPQLKKEDVEDVIAGCANPGGKQGSNIARIAAIEAGFPVTIAGTTVNRFCSSGLQTVALASQRVRPGRAAQRAADPGPQDQRAELRRRPVDAHRRRGGA